MAKSEQIVYCRCKYASIVSKPVKDEVLAGLLERGARFTAVPDLCEMAAKHDPQMQEIAQEEGCRIIACYPRAVAGLFDSVNAPLDQNKATIHNMRTDSAADILKQIDETQEQDG
ncbi:hypothetical protein K8I31_11605 [bacterium]|nr:hypothetical protein [bacterium]